MKTVRTGDFTATADPTDYCRRAHQEGARIYRIDYWYWSSNSGKTDYESRVLVHSGRPRWKPGTKYRVDRNCEWYVRNVLAPDFMKFF
ncbi:hypothetical protein EniLVp02_0020 [Vibrio phage EniLVp02]